MQSRQKKRPIPGLAQGGLHLRDSLEQTLASHLVFQGVVQQTHLKGRTLFVERCDHAQPLDDRRQRLDHVVHLVL